MNNQHATMNAGRRFHTATLLPNLAVLAAGGADASAELYLYAVPSPSLVLIASPSHLPNPAFQFFFTNTPGATFSVLATTNISTFPTNWMPLGPALEFLPGQPSSTHKLPTSNAFTGCAHRDAKNAYLPNPAMSGSSVRARHACISRR